MGFDVPDEHGKQSNAAWTDNRSCLDFVMLDIGWHVGSPWRWKLGNLNPKFRLPRLAEASDQLFRTYKERPYNVLTCGIPVTFMSANVRFAGASRASVLGILKKHSQGG